MSDIEGILREAATDIGIDISSIELMAAADEIECLREENEKLKAALTEEYERGFTDCLKRVEELEREQAERQKERMKPIKDALYPGIYKPHRFKGD